MFSNMDVLSYSLAAVTFGLLTILVVSRYLRRGVDRALALAATVSMIWAATIVSQSLWGQPGFNIRYLVELLRDASWIYLLFALLKDGLKEKKVINHYQFVIYPH